ncbi:molybdopterin synthase sulfur carrier subunit [Alosa pseudoharengus]|uniref:molybdopterin synthase sulfur carrier subunit n=1 Tax=Alosa pseudoharengus TaxID=34774 RepID=UPI003F88B1FE
MFGSAVLQAPFMISEVSVLYFAKGAELTGVKSETVKLPSELTTIQLWQELEKRHPKLCVLREHVVLAVRQEYVDLGDQTVSLHDGDEVAVIPPLSGG